MRGLIILVSVLALAWGGYWFVGRAAAERGIGAGIAVLEAAGWQVEIADRRTRGFPSRFDTTFDAPRLVAPSGHGWSGEFAQIFALSWAPNRIIAAFAPDQQVIWPGGTLDLRAEAMRASARLRLGLDLPLEQATAEAGPVTLRGPGGGATRIGRLLVAFREAGPAPGRYDAFAEATEIALPDPLRTAIDPGGLLPERIGALRLDVGLGFARPLDRGVLRAGLPAVTAITLRNVSMEWGNVTLAASGQLQVTRDRGPEGEVTLILSDWPAVLRMAGELGLIDPRINGNIATGLMLLTRGADRIEAPLAFRAGQMFLGPVPLGPVPEALFSRM